MKIGHLFTLTLLLTVGSVSHAQDTSTETTLGDQYIVPQTNQSIRSEQGIRGWQGGQIPQRVPAANTSSSRNPSRLYGGSATLSEMTRAQNGTQDGGSAAGSAKAGAAAGNPTAKQPATTHVGQDFFSAQPQGVCSDPVCRYFSAFGGWNDLEDFTETEDGDTPSSTRAKFRDGWALGGAIGRYVTPTRRRELEFTYRDNSGDQIIETTPNGSQSQPLDGSVQAYSTMANWAWDLKCIQFNKWRPYAGGGIGVAYIDGEFAFGGSTAEIDDACFAYQGFAGVERPLRCNTSVFAEYRYFGGTEVDLETTDQAGASSTSDFEYQAQNIFLGVRINR